jgi:hypothetical protein
MTLYQAFPGPPVLLFSITELKCRKESYSGEVSATTGAMPDDPHEQGFIGSSSAANFIKHVKQVIDAKFIRQTTIDQRICTWAMRTNLFSV